MARRTQTRACPCADTGTARAHPGRARGAPPCAPGQMGRFTPYCPKSCRFSNRFEIPWRRSPTPYRAKSPRFLLWFGKRPGTRENCPKTPGKPPTLVKSLISHGLDIFARYAMVAFVALRMWLPAPGGRRRFRTCGPVVHLWSTCGPAKIGLNPLKLQGVVRVVRNSGQTHCIHACARPLNTYNVYRV